MHYGKMIRSAAAVSAFALIVSGCSLLGSGGDKEAVDPPPTGSIEETVANMSDADLLAQAASGKQQADSKTNSNDKGATQTGAKDTGKSQSGATQTGNSKVSAGGNQQAAQQQADLQTIYAKDDLGYVVPVTLQIAKTSSPPLTMLQYMIAGGQGDSQLPSGFASLLPKGTKINSLKVKDKVATVDFSKEVLQYELSDERKMLEGVTWALTSVPSVEKVELLVDGKPLSEMPKGKLPVDKYMTRSIGINLEIAEGTDYGRRSTPVTLYYMNVSDSNYKYYVPVTRLIPRTDDVAKAVLSQLIQGPSEQSGLLPTVSGSTRVLSLKPSQGLITVDLSKGLLDTSNQAPGEALQSVILSLTENMDAASKVQLMVEGKPTFQSTDNLNYSKPVSKPDHLNPVKS